MIKLPIIVQPTAGLCNRMRTIAAATVLAELLGRKMVVVWASDATLNASFRSLFKPLPFKVFDVKLKSFCQRLIWHFCTKILRYKVYDDKWIYDNARGKDFSTWKKLIGGGYLSVCQFRYIYQSRRILYLQDYRRNRKPLL